MRDYITSIFDQLLFKNCDTGSVLLTQSMNQHAISDGKHKVIQLPEGAAYFDELHRQLAPDLQRLFILPMLGRVTSDELRERYAYRSFEEITLQVIAESNLQTGALIGVVLPSFFFASQRTSDIRNRIFKAARLLFLIDIEDGRDFFYASCVTMCLAIFRFGAEKTTPLKFFQFPPMNRCDPSDVLSDFKRILKQDGGSTKYGYVIREDLPFDAPLSFELYHPELLKQEKQLAEFGATRKLGELVEVLASGILPRRAIQETDSGCPVIEARDISIDGTINLDAVRKVPADLVRGNGLKSGDIMLRAIIRENQNLIFAEAPEMEMPLYFGRTVTVLRPKEELTIEDRNFLLTYLRSSVAAIALKSRSSRLGSDIRIYAKPLLDLPVPIFDMELRLAYRNITQAVHQFEQWKNDAEYTRNGIFSFVSATEARTQLLGMGKICRLRTDAASKVDDFHHRIRTQFPHPIAFAWRTIEAAEPNLEGYKLVLACAENTLCYLACMALTLARVASVEIAYCGEIAKRLKDTAHGTSMGDWKAIIHEVSTAKAFRNLSSMMPFLEVIGFLADEEVRAAVNRLSEMRNDESHHRGPKGTQKIKSAFDEARVYLETMLQVAEFVAEYPLIFIEDVMPDTLTGAVTYRYRSLMGDHPYVPIKEGITNAIIEKHSLYLVDRSGELRLLRPFLIRRECPECSSWSTFYLDKAKKIGVKNLACMKSMEHGHTFDDEGSVAAFQLSGLL